jgi:hypothetical protein
MSHDLSKILARSHSSSLLSSKRLLPSQSTTHAPRTPQLDFQFHRNGSSTKSLIYRHRDITPVSIKGGIQLPFFPFTHAELTISSDVLWIMYINLNPAIHAFLLSLTHPTMAGLIQCLLLSILPLLTYGQSENATAAEQPFRSFNSTP